MSAHQPRPSDDAALREHARRLLRDGVPPPPSGGSTPERLVHELHVFHAELELQANELRAARDQLQRQLDDYVQLFMGAPSPSLWIGADGRIQDINHAFSAAYPGAAEGVDGAPLEAMVRGRDRGAVRALLAACESGAGVFPKELDVTLVDGDHPRPVRLMASRLCREGRAGSLVLLQVADRRRESESAQEREVLARAIEQVNDAVVITGAAGGREDRIRYANTAAHAVTGFAVSALLGRSPEILHGPETDPAVVEELARARHAGRTVRAVLTLHRPDGTPWRADVQLSPVCDDSGRATHFVQSYRDISSRAAEESQRTGRARLQSLGSLADSAAHDFNNLLAVVLGAATQGLSRTDLAPEVRELLDDIRRAAESGAQLTSSLLAFTQQSVGRAVGVDPFAVIGPFATLLQRSLHSGAELHVEAVPPDVPVLVPLDPIAFEQVLLNLVLNANESIRSAHRHRTGRVRVHLRVEGDACLLEVLDNGAGVSGEAAHRLFAAAEAPKHPADPRPPGLDLANLRRVVSQAGGALTWRNLSPHGAAFTVSLPARPRSADAPQETAESPALVGSAWVIDDDPDVRKVVTRCLQGELRITAFGLPEHALQSARGGASPPDIVITDVLMPGLSGVELIAALREHWGPAVPAVFISGATHARLEAAQLQANDTFVAKPFTRRTLRAAVSALLEPSAPHERAGGSGAPDSPCGDRRKVALSSGG